MERRSDVSRIAVATESGISQKQAKELLPELQRENASAKLADAQHAAGRNRAQDLGIARDTYLSITTKA